MQAQGQRDVDKAVTGATGVWSVLRKGTETTVLTALSFDLAVKAAAALSKLGIECTVRNGGR